MTKPLSLMLTLALLSTPLFVGQAQAADKGKKPDGDKISVMGKVSTTKTDVDNYTSIKLTAQDGKVYNITIDDKGKDVAKQYEGISVLVNGTTKKTGDELWLTVASIGEKKKGKK